MNGGGEGRERWCWHGRGSWGLGISDPKVLSFVDGVLRHASVPVLFRPFGGTLATNGGSWLGCCGVGGCRMGER